jgi:Pla-1/cef family extracellular lipase
VAQESPLDTAFDVISAALLGEEQLGQLAQVGLDNCAALVATVQDPSSPLFATAAQVFGQVGAFCAASLAQGSINLPYYLDPVEPLSGRWTAACANGLALQAIGSEALTGLIQGGTLALGPFNDLCTQATGGQLLDVDLNALGINDLRHLTRFSPIPRPQGSNPDGTETLEVQITIPDEQVVAAIAALNPTIDPITKPEAGWPVVIMGHGITSRKEDFLAITGALSLAGFATVAIDLPLHGSRGFVLEDGTIINASNGFGGNTTDYFNLASLLTARDNTRQGIVDMLGLRLGLNAVVDQTGGSVDLNGSQVFYVGQSLGSIVGASAVAMANSDLTNPALSVPQINGLYDIQAASLHVPGGGIAGFLIESASFGSLVQGSLFAQTSTDFQVFLAQFAADNQLPVNVAIGPAYEAFSANFTTEQQAAANALFSGFVFAAQTVIDSSDPNNLAEVLTETTPVHMVEVIGGGLNDDGNVALTDQVIPNSTALPLSGTEALAAIAGLPSVGSTTVGSGLVRFTTGGHGSVLSPVPSAAATTEAQLQTVNFFVSTLLGQPTIVISNPNVVQP